MTGLRIDTYVLVASLILTKPNDEYSFEDVSDYFDFLSQSFPVFITSNISEQEFKETTEDYPELFVMTKNNKIKSGNREPNPGYFYMIYHENITKFIKNITALYIKEYLDKNRRLRAKKKLLGV